MNREQAVEIIERHIDNNIASGSLVEQALSMAIDALKAQLSKEGTTKDATSDLISKTETAEHLRRMLEATVPNTDYDEGYIDGVEFGLSTVSTMPTIQPVATDTNVGNNSEIPNSSDTVSRQAAIDAIEKNACNTQRIMDAVNNLPPAQPKRAEGEWIVHLYKVGVSRYECDACHARCDIIYPYCPYCGEKKEGERDAIN